ncbi:MAG: DUF3276 family protein [Flavobacteriaceae bacterium]|nr:DUF3276 family protein [Flavobacteriaceae bacterium]
MSNFEYPQSVREVSIHAGSRTYYFDVKKTKACDYFLTITECKRTKDGKTMKKQKLFLYKEHFDSFSKVFLDMVSFVNTEKGKQVIR